MEESMDNLAVKIENISKVYRLYDKPMDRLKESLGLSRKKKFKEHYALSDVSLEIKHGETVGIIGTNGSGKSTLLKIITGVLTKTSGELMVDGRISALLELGAGFNMEYTGIENVYLNGAMTGFSKEEIDQKLEQILEFADIGEFVYQPVKTYSSGMFVRLAFAVAINIEPEILIVDEALSVGDVFFQNKCYKKFEEFKEKGKTILFVSHDLSSISKYCDRVFLLNRGKKIAQGSPKEMIDAYKKVLVGQWDQDDDSSQADGVMLNQEKIKGDYGTKEATIEQIYIVDENGVKTNQILKGSMFDVVMEVAIHEDIPAPIFAVSIKDIKGTEITGTNTMVEKAFLEPVQADDQKQIRFRQKMDLQGGEYLLSFGVTGFEADTFKVYHRLYDQLSITVISDKNTVGYYDMNSQISIL